MIIDGHTHIAVPGGSGIGTGGVGDLSRLSQLRELVSAGRLGCIVNGASVEEFKIYRHVPDIFVSFGIHPWQSEEYGDLKKFLELGEFFRKSDAVGEIGMDSVWCNCDLQAQQRVFECQLKLAEKLNKPVILHTKGMEREIAEILRDYSMKKMIHWYGSEKYLDKYVEMDCYFTVSIDLEINPVMQDLVRRVPIDRLITESDGTEAASWVFDRVVDLQETMELLKKNMRLIGEIKGMDFSDVEKRMEKNLRDFLISG